MAFLRNVFDQVITVRRVTNKLLADEDFLNEVGIKTIPRHYRYSVLKGLVGFVLSNYNAAKTIFRKNKDMDVNEKLVLLAYSRLRVPPSVPEPYLKATELLNETIRELNGAWGYYLPEWDTLNLRMKFSAITSAVFVEEIKSYETYQDLPFGTLPPEASLSIALTLHRYIFKYVPWKLESACDT